MPINKKKMRFKVNARKASKVRERDLLDKAKALMDDPELFLPKCAGECMGCPFERTKAQLARISKFKDDSRKLEKLSKKGDRLARAYAATIGLVHEDKAPYLASAQYPTGSVMFALRGKTSREKLIGVQNYDSAKWRVLAVLDLVKKKKLHFYSYGDVFVCTGKKPGPPEEYVRIAAESVGATKHDGSTIECPHDPDDTNHFEFEWVSAGKRILICDSCAGRTRNSLSKLAEGMAVPDVLDDFDIKIKRPLKMVGGSGDCDGVLDRPVDRDLLQRYSAGELGNKELLEKHLDDVLTAIRTETKTAYIRGDRCFGDDLGAFISDMASDDLEAKALKGLLSGVTHPVFVEAGESVNKLMSTHWSSHGMDALKAVVSEEMAKKYFDESDSGATASPLKTLRQAAKSAESEVVASQIPSYAGLSDYGTFVDGVVRAYKTGGQKEAVAVLDADKSNDHRMRSISHSFYLSLESEAKSWKFRKEELDFGSHLQKFARSLLESDGPEEHHGAFVEFMKQAGTSDELRRL